MITASVLKGLRKKKLIANFGEYFNESTIYIDFQCHNSQSLESCFIISIYARQGCFKGRTAKEAVIMDSFMKHMKKIHENIKVYFFSNSYSFLKGILHFLNATCQLPILTLFSELVDFV